MFEIALTVLYSRIIFLCSKELICKRIVEVVCLASLQLERMRTPCPTPSTTGREVTLLRDNTLVIGCDILEVYRTVPVHVSVVLVVLTISRTAVVRILKHSDLSTKEIIQISYDRDNWERLVVIVLDIGTCYNRACKHSILEKTETTASGITYVELAACRSLAVCKGWSSTVSCIAKCSALWDSNSYIKRTSKELSRGINLRLLELLCVEYRCRVACPRCRSIRSSPFATTILCKSV